MSERFCSDILIIKTYFFFLAFLSFFSLRFNFFNAFLNFSFKPFSIFFFAFFFLAFFTSFFNLSTFFSSALTCFFSFFMLISFLVSAFAFSALPVFNFSLLLFLTDLVSAAVFSTFFTDTGFSAPARAASILAVLSSAWVAGAAAGGTGFAVDFGAVVLVLLAVDLVRVGLLAVPVVREVVFRAPDVVLLGVPVLVLLGLVVFPVASVTGFVAVLLVLVVLVEEVPAVDLLLPAPVDFEVVVFCAEDGVLFFVPDPVVPEGEVAVRVVRVPVVRRVVVARRPVLAVLGVSAGFSLPDAALFAASFVFAGFLFSSIT
jgi:hypothetical protein